MNRAIDIHSGLAAIFIWLAVAGALAFLASIAPGVDDWLRERQYLSGWVQALFGVLAVIAAWVVARMHIRSAEAAERERDRIHRVRHLQAAFVCFSNVEADANRILTADLRRLPVAEVMRICQDAATDINLLMIHEVAPTISSTALNVKAMLRALAAWLGAKTRPMLSEQEVIQLHTYAKGVVRVAARGKSLSWAQITRLSLPDELAAERQMQRESAEYMKSFFK